MFRQCRRIHHAVSIETAPVIEKKPDSLFSESGFYQRLAKTVFIYSPSLVYTRSVTTRRAPESW
jgi:hypothetical protein